MSPLQISYWCLHCAEEKPELQLFSACTGWSWNRNPRCIRLQSLSCSPAPRILKEEPSHAVQPHQGRRGWEGLGRVLKGQHEASSRASLEHSRPAPPLPHKLENSIHPSTEPAPPHRRLAAHRPPCCSSPYTGSKEQEGLTVRPIELLGIRQGTASGKRPLPGQTTLGVRPPHFGVGPGFYRFGAVPRGIAVITGRCSRRSGSPKVRSFVPGTWLGRAAVV